MHGWAASIVLIFKSCTHVIFVIKWHKMYLFKLKTAPESHLSCGRPIQATAHRTAHCVALCDCDLPILTAHDLLGAMNNFQDSARVVRERAVKRLSELQAAGQAQVRMGKTIRTCACKSNIYTLPLLTHTTMIDDLHRLRGPILRMPLGRCM